ncbi:MAG: methionine synthase [Chitinivibrionales bacterium]|nr:methionine synthase [Chitinivibrionales bacterium]
MKPVTNLIRQKGVLVSDGAWGTILQQKGLQAGECPELWNIEHADDVVAIAKSYIDAGSDLIETNSFGGSVFKLEHYGLADRAHEINEAAAGLSRQAAGEKLVIASMGPTGKILMMGEITEEQLYEAFKTQAVALAEGGADALCIETMSAIDEAVCAIKAAKENTRLEIICTFTFEKTVDNTYRTMMGVSPAEMAQAVLDAGADILGSNCGNGIANMVEITRELHQAAPDTPILIHANAGMPEHVDGEVVFPETPEMMAHQTPMLREAGASIIGGCCGTTPGHIRAIRSVLE